jgi:hypothetical protein
MVRERYLAGSLGSYRGCRDLLGGSLVVGLLLCVVGVGAVFVSPALAAAPVVAEASMTEVSDEGAVLHAVVNPEGGTASYRFEYDTTPYVGDVVHGGRAPAPEATVEGSEPVAVEAYVQGLTAATAYHFRLVATNAALEAAYGGEASFTTQAAGGEFTLPDGRVWEMVSPVNKRGAKVEAISKEGGISEAAEDGAAFAYVADGPLVADHEGNPAIGESQYLATRGVGGWSTSDIATRHAHAIETPQLGQQTEWDYFSAELTSGLVEQRTGVPTPPASGVSEGTPYLRGNLLAGEGVEAQYVPLVDEANVLPGTHHELKVKLAGASANLEHVVVRSGVPLTSGPAGFASDELYEWVGGELIPVSVLPDGEWSIGVAALGTPSEENVRDAVSEDGERVFWEGETSPGVKHLFVREVAAGETVQLDVPQEGVEEPEEYASR